MRRMVAYVFNDFSSPLALLGSRRSAKARLLVAPGPDAAELWTILGAASRVPDHGKLAPWRFVVIEDRDAFAALLQRLWQQQHPEATDADLQSLAGFARQAPLLVALLFRPQEGRIPLFEQQLSAGAAGMNLLLSAHAFGYAGNWLTGERSRLPGLAEALGVPGGQVAGFFFLGTPAGHMSERPRPELGEVVLHWRGAVE